MGTDRPLTPLSAQSTGRESRGAKPSFTHRPGVRHHQHLIPRAPQPCPAIRLLSVPFAKRRGAALPSLGGIRGERTSSSPAGGSSRLKPGCILVAALPLPPRLMSCFSNFEAESHGSF